MEVKRGDIFIANLKQKDNNSSIQMGMRPVIVVSNNLANTYSGVITVIPLTSKKDKHNIPTHITIGKECGLYMESIALAEQIMPLDKFNLVKKIGQCTPEIMRDVNKAILIQSGLIDGFTYAEKAM